LQIRYAGGTTSNNPSFNQGSTTVYANGFDLSNITTSSTYGAKFTGGAGLFKVSGSGNFNFDCRTTSGISTFAGGAGTVEIDVGTVTINDWCSSAYRFQTANVLLAGGTQTITNSGTNGLSLASLTTAFTGASQTKTIPTVTLSGNAVFADSAQTSAAVALSTLTVGGTYTINSTGSMTVTNSNSVSVTGATTYNSSGTSLTATNTGTFAAVGGWTVNSSAGTFTNNATSSMTVGSTTTAGATSIATTGSGATILNGTYYLDGNLTTTGTQMSGTGAVTMGGVTGAQINLSTGVLGLSGAFGMNMAARNNTVTLYSNLDVSAGPSAITLTQGQLLLGYPGPYPSTPYTTSFNFKVKTGFTVGVSAALNCGINGTYTGTPTVQGSIVGCSTYGKYWTGASGDHKWSTAGNWAGSSVPTSSDVAVFDTQYCGAYTCAATVDTAASPSGININSSGVTLTISANLTLGSGGFWMYGVASSASCSAAYTIADGGNFVVLSGATFTATNCTLNLNNSTIAAINLDFSGVTGTFSGLTIGTSYASGTAINVFNTSSVNTTTLTYGDTASTASTFGGSTLTINTTGNVTFQGNGYASSTSPSISASGSSPTITGVAAALAPNFTLSATTPTLSGTLNFHGSSLTISSASATTTGSTVQLSGASMATANLGSITYNNLTINSTASTLTLTGTAATVSGTLTISPATSITMTGGTISTTGSTIAFSGAAGAKAGSTTVIQVSGSSSPTISNTSAAGMPSFTANTSGTITFTAAQTFNFLGTTFTWTSGTLSQGAGSTLQFSNSMTITPGTAQYQNVTFTGSAPTYSFSSGTMQIYGNLSMGASSSGACTINSGTIQFKGATLTLTGSSATRSCYGTAVLDINGLSSPGTQQIKDGTAGTAYYLPSVKISAASGGTVQFGGTANDAFTFNGGLDTSTSAATIDASTYTSTVTFNGASPAINLNSTASNNQFYNITFSTTGTATITNTLYASNTLTSTSTGTLNGGGITANGSGAGPFTHTLSGTSGTTLFTFANTGGNATLTDAATPANPVTINATGRTVTSSTTTLGSGTWTVTAGTLSLTGSITASNPTFSVGASGTLTFGATFGTSATTTALTATTGAQINGTSGFTVYLGSLALGGGTYTKNSGTLKVANVSQGTGSIDGGTVNP
jgi:hypothetical protein